MKAFPFFYKIKTETFDVFLLFSYPIADPEDCPRQVKPEEEQNARSVGLSGSFHAEIMEVRRRDIAKR